MLVSQKIENILLGKNLVENDIGQSGDKVYKIEGFNDDKNKYLKIENKERLFGIKREYEVYEFLKGKIKVPEVYYYEYPYLITTEVKGICSFQVEESERIKVMRILAKALKELHLIDIKDFSLLSDLTYEIKNGKNTEDGLLNMACEEYVFVHGDACLPNIIIHEGEFGGFIDMGAAGIGNRYEDLAYCVWSTLYNFKDVKYIHEFFKEYGEEYYDRDKLNFYIRILNPSTIISL